MRKSLLFLAAMNKTVFLKIYSQAMSGAALVFGYRVSFRTYEFYANRDAAMAKFNSEAELFEDIAQ